MTRKCHVRFGGGPTEKARQRDLAGGLPYYHATATDLKASLGAVKRIVGQMVAILGLDEAPQETALAPTG